MIESHLLVESGANFPRQFSGAFKLADSGWSVGHKFKDNLFVEYFQGWEEVSIIGDPLTSIKLSLSKLKSTMIITAILPLYLVFTDVQVCSRENPAS
jgi:hypothetical protein